MRKFWTDSEIQSLILLYPDHSGAEIADALGCKLHRIYVKAKNLGLHKSEAFMKSSLSGRLKHPYKQAWYPKGCIPYNKGKKMSEYVSPEVIKKILKTTFRKGHLPANTRPDGTVTIRRDSHNRSYKWIRISKGVWRALHVHNWENAFGPVPEGYIVVFRTRDNMNCDISNLEIIDRVENMRRNTWYKYPVELRQAMRKLKKLKRTINGKEQDSGPERSPVRNDRVA